MTVDNNKDLGIIITKAPLESGSVEGALELARETVEQGRSVGLFLISDGVWLVKKKQDNKVARSFHELLNLGVQVIVSKDHLEAAGITEDDVMEGVMRSSKIYKDLVIHVMERWNRVMTI